MRNRWLTGGAIKLHTTAVIVIGICLAAGWWQLRRALGGHTPSWAYTIEWPFFAGYAVFTWWKLLHEEPGFAKEEATLATLSANGDAPSNEAGEPSVAKPAEDDEEQKREAYNEYLRALSTDEGRKRG